jgi:hypothetical protein
MAGIRVEEAHERAVRDERHDPLCLVFEGLQTADPEKDDDETDAVTATPTRSARATISKMRVIMRGTVLRVGSAWVIVWFIGIDVDLRCRKIFEIVLSRNG